MTISQLGNLIGGIGLFLLGMKLMTDGLKVASGSALRRILAQSTSTPMRGLMSGILITSLVQSSSAVTVAVIGFVNAGLLTLLQTVYVVYGSNIGTTMTGWLVALVGFDIEIKLLALPLIGVGMVLRLLFKERRGALGEALAGFGLFFLGLDVLKTTFGELGQSIDLAAWPTDGLGIVTYTAIGFMLTLLMQSSSAAMALTLTAATGGVIPLTAAAAVVIGANVGTTSTAALAVIGATSNAQRVAALHVLFNLCTGLIALLLMKPFLELVVLVSRTLELGQSPATVLALFHTLFNILGVLLLWYATPFFVRFVEGRFLTTEEDQGRPRYLDRNIITTPELALNALVLELGRIGEIARAMGQAVMSSEVKSDRLRVERRIISRVGDTFREYTVEMQRSHLGEEISESLPDCLRVLRYYEEVAEATIDIAELQPQLEEVQDPRLSGLLATFRGEVASLIAWSNALTDEYDAVVAQQRLDELESHYQALKASLLRAGADEHIQLQQMVVQLEQYSLIRRLLEQTVKGAQHLRPLHQLAQRYNGSKQEQASTPASDSEKGEEKGESEHVP